MLAYAARSIILELLCRARICVLMRVAEPAWCRGDRRKSRVAIARKSHRLQVSEQDPGTDGIGCANMLTMSCLRR